MPLLWLLLAIQRVPIGDRMILDFGSLDNSTVLETDLCIIGAGAAGITIAREFNALSTNVIVLESGHREVNETDECLNEGEVCGMPFGGLTKGRRRGFGGTTSAWGGQCCELDTEDFSARPWVSNSGWPVNRSELEPFYRRAEHLFGVSGERYDQTNWIRFGLQPVAFDEKRLRTTFSVFSPRPRLGDVYRKLVTDSQNVRLILGATVTNIQTNDCASQATCIDIKGNDGRQAHVRARAFVICAGAIESARLLLLSRSASPNGLGNDNDLVGRYFQDHPTADTASLIPTNTEALQDIYGILYRGRTWFWPKIVLAPETQREAAVLNASAVLAFEYRSSAIEVLREMVRTTRTGGRFIYSPSRIMTLMRGLPSVADAGYRRYVLGRSPRAIPSNIDLSCTIEQLPNPDSRVGLADSLDRLGMQRAKVEWKITNTERDTFRVITKNVTAEFGRLGLATVVPRPWLESDDLSLWKVRDNYHQTGTTRMAVNPKQGVVDSNCQVHGINGLFVSGAPTFPTSGYANPVLTISAMSIRLSDYLKQSVLR